MAGRPNSPRRTTGGTKSTAKSAAAKKPTAKKSTARKPTAKKSTAQKATAKKPVQKKATAKKPTARKPTAKKPAARQPTAKKLTSARSAAKKSGPPDPWFSRDQLRGVVPVVLVAGLAIAVLGGLAVLPARTWLSQRQNMADAQAELEQIEVDVAELEDDLELLGTEDEIERLARKNFDLVYPGEESYRIVPPEDG